VPRAHGVGGSRLEGGSEDVCGRDRSFFWEDFLGECPRARIAAFPPQSHMGGEHGALCMQEAPGGVGLCGHSPPSSPSTAAASLGMRSRDPRKAIPGKSLPGFAVTRWLSKGLSATCPSEVGSRGDLSTLAPSRGACRGWALAAGIDLLFQCPVVRG